MENEISKINRFEIFANKVTRITGSNAAFLTAVSIILLWLISGPIFHFSDTWQLIINTGTTIVTFLMVFLIQKSQNKDSIAIQIKLNELVAANEKASNRLVSVEQLSEKELIVLSNYYSELAEMSKKDDTLQMSHSIEEAQENHEEKLDVVKKKTKK